MNQPKLPPNASWNPDAITFSDITIVGSNPFAMFVSADDALFTVRYDNGDILIWPKGSANPTTRISTNIITALSLLVTRDEQIFVGYPGGVARWTSNGTQLQPPIPAGTVCPRLFIDQNNNIYCSQWGAHRVVRKSLQNLSKTLTLIAGTGSASYMLNNPVGVFVTDKLDLYVADWGNDRVQLFRSGETTATTVAGNGASGTVALYQPVAVVLDADGYLFITDEANNRIVGSGPDGFRCVVGCSPVNGSRSSQLNAPQTMSFDSTGNIYVLDRGNDRIQKFLLAENSYDTCKRKVFLAVELQLNYSFLIRTHKGVKHSHHTRPHRFVYNDLSND